jgi:hypothetical protein
MPVTPAAPAPRGKRRPVIVALALALAIAGALGASWLVGAAGDRITVVALARDVPYGTVLTREDLTLTDVAVDAGVRVVPADDVGAIVGQFSASDLVAGSLLASGQVTGALPPGEGEELIGLSVPANRVPAGGLRARDRLLLVDTPSADADPPTRSPASFEVSVVRVGAPDLNGVSVVDVVAPTGDGPAVAVRAATGRFTLVVQPRGGR